MKGEQDEYRPARAIRGCGFTVVLAFLFLFLSAGVTSSDGVPLETAGGVLRWGTAPHWVIYGNGHIHRGITSVTCNAQGRLIVGLDVGSGQVGFGAVTVDEHLAAKGITVGVSGSKDHLTLFFYRLGRQLSCASHIFQNKLANVWVLWMVPE